MLRRGAAGVLLVLAGVALPAHGQGAVTLEWKLKKGDQFYLRTVSTSKQTLKIPGRESRQELEQTLVLGFTVEDKTAEGLVLRQTVEGLTVKSGGGTPVADERVVGAAFLITLSPKGEVLKFEGHDKFIEKLAGDDAGVRKTLQVVLSEEALKLSVREALAFLPDRPVKEGATWERTAEAPLGPLGTLRMTNTYKLEGKDDVGGKKVEKMSFTRAVDFKPAKADPALPYHVVSGELKAEDAKGTVHFDAAAGRLVQSRSKLNLKGRMILSLGGSNIDAEVQQEQSTEVALLNENPVKKEP